MHQPMNREGDPVQYLTILRLGQLPGFEQGVEVLLRWGLSAGLVKRVVANYNDIEEVVAAYVADGVSKGPVGQDLVVVRGGGGGQIRVRQRDSEGRVIKDTRVLPSVGELGQDAPLVRVKVERGRVIGSWLEGVEELPGSD